MNAFLLMSMICAADVESGPKVDVKVPDLKVNFVTGTHEGKEIDLPGERKDEPTVYFFINGKIEFARPVFRLMKEVDNKIAETNDKAAGYAIWVGVEKDELKTRIGAISQSAKFAKMEVAWLKAGNPEGWGLNDDAHLTVVVVKKAKVSKVFAWKSVNETDAKAVLEALK